MLLALAENSIQLVPDGTLLFHIALIILMILFLNGTLFRPINRILEERERQTLGRSDEAQAILKRVQSKADLYEQTLRAERTEGYHYLQQQNLIAMHKRQNSLNLLREELQGSLEEQKHLIQIQTEKAKLSLTEDSNQIAIEVSQQILGRQLNYKNGTF